MQKRKTKIVCTLGPTSSDDDVLRKLIQAGMNVARLNFSHGTYETHGASIERVRRISKELGITVAIALDIKGPAIRTGKVENDGKITINTGDKVNVVTDDSLSTAAQGQTPANISISWKQAATKLQTGNHILIADGLLLLEVLTVANGVINCLADNNATFGSNKNVDIIGVHPGLPIMNEKDKADLAFGAKMQVDYIFASFVCFPHEVTEIRTYLESLGSNLKIFTKIESPQGLENIHKIAQLADGVMVARGDLGEQIPIEQVPLAQKHIIATCRRLGKPVITATQMLDSMIVNPRPTRAELTDVANAIFDGTDAIMLSGETANGAYPVQAVQTMDKIARTVEESEEFRARMRANHDECFQYAHNAQENLAVIMSRSGAELATSVKAKAIVTPTLSGNTARLLSVFRPDEPILAVTPDKNTEQLMQVYWGVHAFQRPHVADSESMIQDTMKVVAESGIAGIADKVVLVAGLPLNSPFMVNTVRTLIIGNVLARSTSGGSSNPEVFRARGRIVQATNPAEARERIMAFGGDILVCRVLTEDYTPILRIVNGVICEGVSEINEEDLRTINPDLVWMTHIRHAIKKLESGLSVTMDAKQLLVYEGSI